MEAGLASGDFRRFVIAGTMATAAHFAVLGSAVAGLGWSAAAGTGLGAFVGSVISYLLNRTYVFASDKPHPEAVPRFYLMVGATWLLNIGLMAVLVDWLGWNLWIAQAGVTGACLVSNFLWSRHWVFSA